MPQSKTKIINIICHSLPYELSNQIYHEYESRFKEASYLIENFSYYKQLEKDFKLVELVLALSIFHKRFITNLDAASKFYHNVSRSSEAEAISIGSYDLNDEENRKIYGTLLMYRELRRRFGLGEELFEYYETKELLKHIINLKKNLGNYRNRKNNSQEKEDDIPF